MLRDKLMTLSTLFFALSLQTELFASGAGRSCAKHLPKLASQVDFPDSHFASFEEMPISATSMLQGYREGWYAYHDGWERPEQRAIYRLADISIGKSTRGVIRRAERMGLRISFNSAFEKVVEGCRLTDRGPNSRVWLTPEIQQKYIELYNEGYAYSIEIWDAEGNLLAGSFGTIVDAHVHAESMFRADLPSNLSGIGHFLLAVEQSFFYLKGADFIDEQVAHAYKIEKGVSVISGEDYLELLAKASERNLFSDSEGLIESEEFDFFSIFAKMEKAKNYRIGSLER